MATLEKKNIQIHKQPNITGLNEFGFFLKKSENKIPKQAECNTKCAGNRDVQSPVFSGRQHTASYQCRKCRHEAGQNRQRTYLKGHPKTGRKIRE